jgi:hypothetical protein
METRWWVGTAREYMIPAANPTALCPDLLRYEQLGAADTWRGRVVRGVFWLLRAWPAWP